ncbi:MAG: VPLPA-CTERM sorting domain-containing protein [Hyphomicrobiales bacterium]
MTMFKRTVRSGLFAAVAAVGLATSQAPASAVTYQINFDQDFNGSIDWIGTFDSGINGGAISNFKANINGTLFNNPIVSGNLSNNLQYIDLQIENTTPGSLLTWLVVFHINPNLNKWGDVSCLDNLSCAGLGTYTISQIPIPAALPMFAAGLAGVGYVSRRKRKA